MKIEIKKLSENAAIPSKDEGNAGYDLYAIEDIIIPPQSRSLVKTGITMSIPNGYYGHISDRSGMAYKKGAHCLGKIIDSSYRGEIGIIILNTDKEKDLVILALERPAQIIFKKYEDVDFEEVVYLDETLRGVKGYGASGA